MGYISIGTEKVNPVTDDLGGKVMAVAGAIPVLDPPNIIGAVGVSGGTEEQEQECCRAAVATYS